MHYLGKEQPFIQGKCGLFGAVWLVPAQAASERESWGVPVTACLSIPIAMILVRMGIGILSLYLFLLFHTQRLDGCEPRRLPSRHRARQSCNQ
jgi:hypothetical protein